MVVVKSPANAQFLQKRQIYSSQDFLDAMRKEQYVIGIEL